jgi:hypothetical protein
VLLVCVQAYKQEETVSFIEIMDSLSRMEYWYKRNKEQGISFDEYLWEKRINELRNMLANGKWSE